MFLSRARLFGALISACALAGLVAVPPADAATLGYDCVTATPSTIGPYQPLQVCASFDKAVYSSGDTVKLMVSVTNVGTATAPGVVIYTDSASGTDHFIGRPVGPLIDGSGIDLPVGQTITSEVDGYAADPASGSVTFSAPVYQTVNGTGSAFGDVVNISSEVTSATGGYSGVVFNDANGNGQPDPGEGLAGAQITLTGPFNGINGNQGQAYQSTSDSDGHVDLTGLPSGRYSVTTSAPSGWYVQPPTGNTVTVGTGSNAAPGLLLAGPLPLPLTASMSFDQPSYHAGDTANLTMSLTNTGTSTLFGIKADCNPGGEGSDLDGTGNGWNQFVGLNAPGLTISAGQTTILHLSEIVPVEQGQDSNLPYYADCVFSQFPGYEFTGAPETVTSAQILQPTVPTTSFVPNFVDDDPLGGAAGEARLSLIDPTTQDVVAGGLFGEPDGGTVEIGEGSYELSLPTNGGWVLAPGQSSTVDTSTLTPGQTVTIHVVPAVTPAPPTPPLLLHGGKPIPAPPHCGTVCSY